jgi:hypothetical protein
VASRSPFLLWKKGNVVAYCILPNTEASLSTSDDSKRAVFGSVARHRRAGDRPVGKRHSMRFPRPYISFSSSCLTKICSQIADVQYAAMKMVLLLNTSYVLKCKASKD